MRRNALTLTAALTLGGLLALSGCGADTAPTAAGAAVVDVADEAYALSAVGLETGLAPAPNPSASASASAKDKGGRHPEVRKYLRKNTLHGEVTVQRKDGVRTIVVQRGTVTAVDATTVSLRSTDGFTQTWTFGEKLRVRQDRKAVERSALKTGVEVGVAGVKDGDENVARLAVVGR